MSGLFRVANNVKMVFGTTKYVAFSSAAAYVVALNMGLLPALGAKIASWDKFISQPRDSHKVTGKTRKPGRWRGTSYGKTRKPGRWRGTSNGQP